MEKHVVVSLSDNIDELHLPGSKVLVTHIFKTLSNLWQPHNKHLAMHKTLPYRLSSKIQKEKENKLIPWGYGLGFWQHTRIIWQSFSHLMHHPKERSLKSKLKIYSSTSSNPQIKIGTYTLCIYVSLTHKWKSGSLKQIRWKERLTGDLGKMSRRSIL